MIISIVPLSYVIYTASSKSTSEQGTELFSHHRQTRCRKPHGTLLFLALFLDLISDVEKGLQLLFPAKVRAAASILWSNRTLQQSFTHP